MIFLLDKWKGEKGLCLVLPGPGPDINKMILRKGKNSDSVTSLLPDFPKEALFSIVLALQALAIILHQISCLSLEKSLYCSKSLNK